MSQNLAAMNRFVDWLEAGATAFCIQAGTECISALQRRMPIKSGHAKSAITASLGSLAPGFPERNTADSYVAPTPEELMLRGAGAFRLGDTIAIGNRAAHFPVIAPGRYEGSDGKMKGSEQHPTPIVPAAIEDTQTAMQKWRYLR